jgi:hypothetical protein
MAAQIQSNTLLAAILTEFQAEILGAWRSANTVDMREMCAAQDRSLTTLRNRINERVKRELGDKQP